MKINGEFVIRDIEGEMILVPVGESALNMNGIIALNETAALIWQKLSQGQEKPEIIQSLLEEFDIDPQICEKDFDEFTEKLIENGLLVK